MKVLMINSFFTVGGPPAIVNGLYDLLKSNGHDCKIAASREMMYSFKDSYRIGNGIGTYFYALFARLFDCDGFLGRISTKKLIKYIRNYNPDVIHIHNLHGYYINIPILFTYLKNEFKGKVILTIHDCWTFTGHCTHFHYFGCEKWKTGCYKCGQKKMYPKSILFDNSKKHYNSKKQYLGNMENMVIVSPSEWLAELAKISYFHKNEIITINNGIDTGIFNSNNISSKSTGKKFVVLCCAAHFTERKGVIDAIKINKLLDDRYEMIVVGQIAEKYKNQFKNTTFIPLVKNPLDLVAIYKKSDVFINLTKEDTFSNVNMESIACGTPVITYRAGGSAEMINSKCGIVVESGDFLSVFKKIEWIYNKRPFNKKEVADIGKQFDKQLRYRDYLELYKK